MLTRTVTDTLSTLVTTDCKGARSNAWSAQSVFSGEKSKQRFRIFFPQRLQQKISLRKPLKNSKKRYSHLLVGAHAPPSISRPTTKAPFLTSGPSWCAEPQYTLRFLDETNWLEQQQSQKNKRPDTIKKKPKQNKQKQWTATRTTTKETHTQHKQPNTRENTETLM